MTNATIPRTTIDWTRTLNGAPAPKLRRKKLRATLAHIVLNPEAHNQSGWVFSNSEAPEVEIPGNGTICGTAACFAGWTLILDHKRFKIDKDDWNIVRIRPTSEYTEEFNGVSATAQTVLGLTGHEAHALFYDAQSFKQVVECIRRIEAGFYRYKVTA